MSGNREMTPEARAALNGSNKLGRAMGYVIGPRLTNDDLGNANRFADMYKGRALHVDGLGWLVYDGKRWARDNKGAVLLAKQTVESIWDEATEARSDGSEAGSEKAKRLATWAHRSRSSGAITAMLKLAEPELSAKVEQLDASPALLNLQNGVFDLDAMTLRPHSPDDLLMRICAANYAPDAPCPLWQATVERFQPDPVARAFVQRSLGAALYGRSLKSFFFWHGPHGDNGKTTLLRGASMALGDYAASVEIDSLCAGKRDAGAESNIAALMGARLVQCEETNGHRLDEGLIKRMTGEGDKLHAKFMGQNKFSFDVSFKLFMFGNARPRMSVGDKALWKRVNCVPFDVVIPRCEQIENFSERLRGELDGIMAWLIEGYRAWRCDGLNPPDAVVQATEAHRAENDELAQFIAENCITGPQMKVPVATFKEAFAKAGGSLRQRELSRQMRERFGEPQRGAGGTFFYAGLGLLSMERVAVE